MILSDYFDSMTNAVEFLMAIGSILGLLGLIFGFFLIVWGGKRAKQAAFGILVFSFIIVGICGYQRGIRYFRI